MTIESANMMRLEDDKALDAAKTVLLKKGYTRKKGHPRTFMKYK